MGNLGARRRVREQFALLGLHKTQTTSPAVALFRRCLARWSAFWAPHRSVRLPRWGNGSIRATTRRRHAATAPLMLQNPHTAPASGTTAPDSEAQASREIGRTTTRGVANSSLATPLLVFHVSVQDARQEVPGGLLARVIDDLLGRTLLDDLSVPQEHDAVGCLAGEADLVRRHEDG